MRGLAAAVLTAIALALLPASAAAATAQPYFEATGSLYESRTNAAAVALADGRVLVAGGCRYSSPYQHYGCTVPTAELYDPEAGTFSPTGRLAYGRVHAAAAPLPGGKALVAGGANTEGPTPAVTTAEVFDPEAGTFTLTAGAPLSARWAAAAAPLPDGRVLIAGGIGAWMGSAVSSAEIFDPETGTFSATGSMATARYFGLAAPLPDGRVLVAGGFASGGSAEIFDPETETFSPTGSMVGETALMVDGASLADGSVIVFSEAGHPGYGPPPARDIQRYDPLTGAFSQLSLASPPRGGMAVASLPGGRLLVAGGSGDDDEAWLGHEVVPTAEIFVSAPSPQSAGLDFGAVPVSATSGPEALTVTNKGAQVLEIEAVSLTGPDAADFEIVVNGCTGETLAFGESCELSIAVTPSSAGPLAAAVQLTSNAPSSPQSFPLSANAEAPAPRTTVPPKSQSDEAVLPPAHPAAAHRKRHVKRPCRRAVKRGTVRCARALPKRHRARAHRAS